VFTYLTLAVSGMATSKPPLMRMNEILDYFLCVIHTSRVYSCVERPWQPEVVEVQNLSLDIPISGELLVIEKYVKMNCTYNGFVPSEIVNNPVHPACPY
jgi:hypothetical protein